MIMEHGIKEGGYLGEKIEIHAQFMENTYYEKSTQIVVANDTFLEKKTNLFI